MPSVKTENRRNNPAGRGPGRPPGLPDDVKEMRQAVFQAWATGISRRAQRSDADLEDTFNFNAKYAVERGSRKVRTGQAAHGRLGRMWNYFRHGKRFPRPDVFREVSLAAIRRGWLFRAEYDRYCRELCSGATANRVADIFGGASFPTGGEVPWLSAIQPSVSEDEAEWIQQESERQALPTQLLGWATTLTRMLDQGITKADWLNLAALVFDRVHDVEKSEFERHLLVRAIRQFETDQSDGIRHHSDGLLGPTVLAELSHWVTYGYQRSPESL